MDQDDDRTTAEQISDLNERLDKLSNRIEALETVALRNIIKLTGDTSALVRELMTRLYGDKDAQDRYEADHAKWAEAKKGYVTPIGPEPQPPPAGEVQDIVNSLSMLAHSHSDLATRQDEINKKIEKVLRWMDPLLLDPSFAPPLDANVIATKKFVDESVERIAGRIRTEVRDAIHVTDRLAHVGASLLGRAITGSESRVAYLNVVADTIRSSWKWISDEIEARKKPSRISIARKAIGDIISGNTRE